VAALPDGPAWQDRRVAPDRDVAAFDRRAPGYESGWLGRLHHDIADRAADLALACCPDPDTVLDVGCGTGYLLRRLAARLPRAAGLAGIDPAPRMIETARGLADDERLSFAAAAAERLPFPDGRFHLLVSTTSFDHWADQGAGLAECARVLAPGGTLVLADQFSAWLVLSMLGTRRGRARTKGRANRLLAAAGLRSVRWHELYGVIIRAATAIR
jgi:ubiquinone/menaquinone biosynthesis C-methylase UbiE